jgi:hypothetical protein
MGVPIWVWLLLLTLACFGLMLILFKNPQTPKITVPDKSGPKILVYLPCPGLSVTNIFETADRPDRVFVTAMYLTDYHARTRSGTEIQYDGEDILLALRPEVCLKPGWDTVVEANVNRASKTAVFTQFLAKGKRAGFPILQGFHSRQPWPKFVGAESRVERSFKVGVATLGCLYGHAKQLLPFFQGPKLQYLGPTEDDLLLSFELWRSGLTVFTPSCKIVRANTRTPATRTLGKAELQERARSLATMRFLLLDDESYCALMNNDVVGKFARHRGQGPEFFKWLGVDVVQQSFEPRAVFGILPDAQGDDILARFKSIADYQFALDSLAKR